jgi:hypothetical protein
MRCVRGAGHESDGGTDGGGSAHRGDLDLRITAVISVPFNVHPLAHAESMGISSSGLVGFVRPYGGER